MTRRAASAVGRVAGACALGLALGLAAAAWARTIALAPGDPWPALAPGDEVVLRAGAHGGPWTLDVPDVRVRAEPGAVVDGGGLGSVVTVTAPGVRLEGLEIVGVGPEADLYAPHAALALLGAHGAAVTGLRAHGATAGVHVEDAADVVLSGLDLRGVGRGPGVTAYLTPGLRLEGSRIEGFLDGVYLERADGAHVASVTVRGSVRYGLHVMFTTAAVVRGNVVADGGVGSAVMYGRDALLEGNAMTGHRGPMAFGLLLQEERGAVLRDNELRDNAIGLLLVAAPGAEATGHRIERNGIGVLVDRVPPGVAADATSVVLADHVFLANAADVAVADADAALALHGNRFDRAPGLDLDDDGVLDLPYVATSAFAARAARQSDLMLLAYGPGIALWQRLEANVPGLRASAFADPAPRRAPAVERAPGAGLAAVWVAAALAAFGLAAARGWP